MLGPSKIVFVQKVNRNQKIKIQSQFLNSNKVTLPRFSSLLLTSLLCRLTPSKDDQHNSNITSAAISEFMKYHHASFRGEAVVSNKAMPLTSTQKSRIKSGNLPAGCY